MKLYFVNKTSIFHKCTIAFANRYFKDGNYFICAEECGIKFPTLLAFGCPIQVMGPKNIIRFGEFSYRDSRKQLNFPGRVSIEEIETE